MAKLSNLLSRLRPWQLVALAIAILFFGSTCDGEFHYEPPEAFTVA